MLATLLAVVILVVGIAIGWLSYTSDNPATGIVVESEGVVQTRSDELPEYQPAEASQIVEAGDWVRTGDSSSATILFFDTSTVELEPNTEVTLLEASTTRNAGGGNLALEMLAGRTAVRMVRFADPTSAFVIETPTASTTIRGAQVTFDVEESGRTEIEVEIGRAEIAAQRHQENSRPTGYAKVVAAPVLQSQVFVIFAGQKLIITPAGEVTVEDTTSPDGSILNDLVQNNLTSGDGTFSLTVDEKMVNDYIATTDIGLGDNGIDNATVWFSNGTVILGGQIIDPPQPSVATGPFTVVAVPHVTANGTIGLTVQSASVAGVPIPVELVSSQVGVASDSLQNQAGDQTGHVVFESVVVGEGQMTLTGHVEQTQ